MDVRFLRIGNSLLFKGKEHKVSSLHSDGTLRFKLNDISDVSIGCYTAKSIYIRPIELGVDVLLPLGFIQDGLTFRKGKYIIWLNFGVCNYDFKIFDVRDDTNKDFTCYSKTIAEIKYLHELQNLWFALEKKELIN